jgi:flavin-dependent dehydrogenase
VITPADALVIGAGPAGAAISILLATAGWRVILVEQQAYPRQKVCGECISAGSLSLLDELGVGPRFREVAGPDLRQVGWMGGRATLIADFPPCREGIYAYGRALGRDQLDEILVERARAAGAEVIQPAKVSRVRGRAGDFVCDVKSRGHAKPHAAADSHVDQIRHTRVVIDAHGSWEPGPAFIVAGTSRECGRTPMHPADLFAFKASFQKSDLAPGLLPVIAFPGGYGGIVVAEGGRTTLACCIRRDALKLARASLPGVTAGEAVSAYLRVCCPGLRKVIDPQRREGAWLSAGPIRPGVRVDAAAEWFRVGNAAGESHPLIGEGISMALQSAFLLAAHLLARPVRLIDGPSSDAINHRYAAAWRSAFVPRLRFARAYAHAAMHPTLSAPLHVVLRQWPALLTQAAQWAGKARRSPVHMTSLARSMP